MVIGTIGSMGVECNLSLSVSRKQERQGNEDNGAPRMDAASISPEGRNHSRISQLIKQKQDLTDKRNQLKSSAEAQGKVREIQTQLAAYDAQIQALDAEIARIQASEAADKRDSAFKVRPESESDGEIRQNRLDDVVELSGSLDQARTISGSREAVEGRIRALNSEVDSGFGNAEAKAEEISGLEARSRALSGELGEKIGDTYSAMAEDEDKAEKAGENSAGEEKAAEEKRPPESSL